MFVVGLDLGQKQDYTAVAVVERIERAGEDKPLLHLRHLERYALGTPYGEQVDRVARLCEDIRESAPRQGVMWIGENPPRPPSPRQPELIVDATGVGVGVVEMLKERGLRYRAVSIAGGVSETRSGGVHHVPKRNLVSRAVAPLEGKRLKIARGMRLVGELVKELENFKVKVNVRTAHDSYEAWRESDHDDLVLALSLACWWAERRPTTTQLVQKPAGL